MENVNRATLIKLEDLKPNMPLEGIVSKIELFGAFIDVGTKLPGLVHISKLKRGQVNRIQDILQEGQKVQVWVEKVDKNSGRLELTMIRPIELAWKDIKPGLKRKGIVVRLEKFGVFVDIGAERPGLVHVSEISSDYVADPHEKIKQGDKIDVVVLDTDRKKRQIRLSIKAAEDVEEIFEEDEPEEVTLTAMEIALRKAMHAPEKSADKSPSEKVKTRKELKSRGAQDEILSRTLKERVKSSTDKE